jgi:16S rRNA (guanine966-N2)-methyltransferase
MKSIKILSGQLKNRNIFFSEKVHLRPTSHYIRQSVFNIVLHRFLSRCIGMEHPFAGMKVLDLFAGTGSYGIEALSRGADHATFVESDGGTAHNLDVCLQKWHLSQRSRVIYSSFPCAIPDVGNDRSVFDLIFVDPPYAYTTEQIEKVLQAVSSLLSPTGILVLEYPLLVSVPFFSSTLSRAKGKKRITFFTHPTS